jgi:hypothetical protein
VDDNITATTTTMEALLAAIGECAATLFTNYVLGPLYHVYINGPTWAGYGFWGGARDPDICFAISGVSAQHWEANRGQCALLIERKAYAFALATLFLGTLLVSVYALSAAVHYFCTIRPIAQALAQLGAPITRRLSTAMIATRAREHGGRRERGDW